QLEQQDCRRDRSGSRKLQPSAARRRICLPPKRGAQCHLEIGRRLLLPQRRAPGQQSLGKAFLPSYAVAALPALNQVRQRLIAFLSFQRAVARQIDNRCFYFLAVHAKALFPALIFSSSIARPRWRRERTVPTAQSSAAAASA